jgi:hypothetical protein
MIRIGSALVAGFLPALSLYLAGSAQPATRTVLFALQRSERLHTFDAETLEHLGHFVTGPLGDSLGVRPDGRRLFLLQPSRDVPNSCCSLRTIDLATREMCHMGEFAAGGITVAGGLVTAGQAVYDAQTLAPIPVPPRRFYAYLAIPSANGRYTASIDRRPGPVIVFTDTTSRTTRELPIPEDARAGGWIGGRYVLAAASEGKARIWAISPSDTSLPEPRAVTWPDAHSRLGSSFVLGSDLVTYTRVGGHRMVDLREDRKSMPGGAIVIPSAGGAARRIARDIHFTELIPGLDGQSLYGLEAGPLHGTDPVPVRLVKLDERTGAVTTTLVLNNPKLFPSASFDVWSLAIANVPADLVPKGEAQIVACRTR